MSPEFESLLPETPLSPGDELEPTPLDSEEAPKAGAALPVAEQERVVAVDVLRGVALLGILAMNIVAFGWPGSAYENPMRGGGFTGADRGVWVVNHILFEEKMMTTFSMLFGAGLVLMSGLADARGAKLRGVYYRRLMWLLVIGLVHAYLIWDGDILVLYAVCGMALYPFRRKTPKTLLIVGLIFISLTAPLILGFGAAIDFAKAVTKRVDEAKRDKRPVKDWEEQVAKVWKKDLEKELTPDPVKRRKKWDEEMTTMRGRYPGIVKHRAKEIVWMHLFSWLFVFPIGGRMLLGMALMKWDVYSAARPRRFYATLLAVCYGIGVPLMIYDVRALIRHEFKIEYLLHGGSLINEYGSIVMAVGHAALVMLIVQAGAIPWLTARLAAVGRTALSNYLADSLICTTLFYGYGFGRFGHVNRLGLFGIVLTLWIIQLTVSPIWLKHFLYGPAEWLWRSLTYWKLQPLRRAKPPSLVEMVA